MPLTLYFAHGSPPSRGVLLLMRKLKLEFDLKIIDCGAGDQFKEDFLKLNPLHQVPVLVDDDFVLTESRAIMGYLVGKYGQNSSLYPVDPTKRAKIDERLYYDATVVFSSILQIILSVLYERVKKIPEKQRENLINTLNVLERFLNQNSWFAGNEMTIADISIVSTITTIKALGYDLTKHPKLNEWYQKLESTLPNFDENVNGANSLAERMFNIMDDKLTVLMTIRNLNIEVELINVNFSRRENMNEDFLKLNPTGQVPVLVDDNGFILTESRAILAYLVQCYAPLVASRDENSSLYPLNDPIKRALIDERLHFDATTVFHSHVQILHPMIAKSDPKIPEEKKKILRNVLSILNGFLDNKNWFTGDSKTIADFSILSNLIVILCAGIRIGSYKNLSAWYERCKGLTGFDENYKGGRMVMELLKKKNLPPISL